MENTKNMVLILKFLFILLFLSGCTTDPNLKDIADNICTGGSEPKAKTYVEGEKIIHKSAFAFLTDTLGTPLTDTPYNLAIEQYPREWMAKRKEDLEFVVCIRRSYRKTGEKCGPYSVVLGGAKNIDGIGHTIDYSVQVIEAKSGKILKDFVVSDPTPGCPENGSINYEPADNSSITVLYAEATENDVVNALLPILGPFDINEPE